MKKICFATNNPNKLKEIKELLGNQFEIVSLKDIGCEEELPETQDTMEGNSLQKARYVFDHYNIDCFADDSGLEVEALNGAPGVYSARYAGLQRNNEDNMALLLQNLQHETNRSAQFRTVVTLTENGKPVQFEGIIKGLILREKKGNKGFGYDPLFVPEGHKRSFAEMSAEEKNKCSHRARAIEKLTKYLLKN
ncbi:MAG: non-canonical purine NTP diphosphatase [Cytophagales bacterium]|nr:non-canonical purine NTP diphosphatase [Cytophagales bacterium]